MKALVIFLMPAMMLIGCGQMETNEDTAENVLLNLNANGSLSNQDISNVNSNFTGESVGLTETGTNSVLLKLGGAELLIDFIDELRGDPEETAMIINGVEVAAEIVANPSSLQGLIASMVTAQVEDVDILGIPANDLVEVGLGLITGDTDKADFSNLFGTLVRGVFNNFLSGSPFGAIFGQIADQVLDNLGDDEDDQGNNGQTDPPNNDSKKDDTGKQIVSTLINAVGGAVAGSNPILGGIFNLITNLFK